MLKVAREPWNPRARSSIERLINSSPLVTKASFTIGNGVATAYTVTHNLGTKDIVVSLRLASNDEHVLADIISATNNTATITFAVAPASNAIKVTVIG